MEKISLFLMFALLSCNLFAQSSNTSFGQNNYDYGIYGFEHELDDKDIIVSPICEISSHSNIEAGEFHELFQVEKSVNKELVGCKVVCQVIEKRKSNIMGQEGRLSIRPIAVVLKDKGIVRLQPTDIVRRGMNISNVKFWTCWLIIPVFIPGTGAYIQTYENIALRLE